VKNHDFTPKNHIFSNFRGGARRVRPPPESTPVNGGYIIMFDFNGGYMIMFDLNGGYMIMSDLNGGYMVMFDLNGGYMIMSDDNSSIRWWVYNNV
jgi:hypothetical protein